MQKQSEICHALNEDVCTVGYNDFNNLALTGRWWLQNLFLRHIYKKHRQTPEKNEKNLFYKCVSESYFALFSDLGGSILSTKNSKSLYPNVH